MGKSLVVPFVVEERTVGWKLFSHWCVKSCGKPTVANLQRFRTQFVNSTRKGGCNEHLRHCLTSDLRIRRQKDGVILVEYVAPVFEVIN
jgi:hypothetical protein